MFLIASEATQPLVIGMIVMFFWNSGVTVLLFLGGRKDRRVERLEGNLDLATKNVIAAEIATVSSGLKNLTTQVTQMNRRMDENDGTFDGLVKSDHTIELKSVQQGAALREWVMNTAATKEDVRELSEKMDVLQRSISTALINRIEGAAQLIQNAAEKIDSNGNGN